MFAFTEVSCSVMELSLQPSTHGASSLAARLPSTISTIPKTYENVLRNPPSYPAHKLPAPSSMPITPFVLQINHGHNIAKSSPIYWKERKVCALLMLNLGFKKKIDPASTKAQIIFVHCCNYTRHTGKCVKTEWIQIVSYLKGVCVCMRVR